MPITPSSFLHLCFSLSPPKFGMLLELAWIEYQVTGTKMLLFLIAWYSQEVIFSILWYYLTILELLVYILQWLIQSNYQYNYVDSWGSPFAVPSILPTDIAALVTYVILYHLWWHKPSWKPSPSTLFYTVLYLSLAAYWCFSISLGPIQLMISIVLGVAYAVLSFVHLKYILLDYIIEIMRSLEGTMWLSLIGSKNVLLLERTIPSASPFDNNV